MESLEFSYDTSIGSGHAGREFDEPPREVTFKGGGGGNGAKINDDEVIEVKVEWDSFEESFELLNESS
ncbi:hypothetical protein ACDX78_22715 [Virgibacillus oceani]